MPKNAQGLGSWSRRYCSPELHDRNLHVPSTRIPEAVEDYPRGVRAVKGVEMNTGDATFQKIMTLFQGVLNPDAPDHFGIGLATLKSAQKLRRETRAARQLGHAL